MKPVVSVKELMRDLIDPLADNIFDSVAIVIDKNGTVERKPTTEADWDQIRIGGTTMAEAASSLRTRIRSCSRTSRTLREWTVMHSSGPLSWRRHT
jgi:hypothetical protein